MKKPILRFNLAALPSDSILRQWSHALSQTELPNSYQVASGLATIGALLLRNVFFDHARFRVWPNLSVLFVGPSGVGKDTIINQTMKAVRAVAEETHGHRIIAGKTMELLNSKLATLGDPAAAIITAPELTSLIGGKEYQRSMINEFTDLLSGNDVMDTSVKSEQRIIRNPTVTMLAGSTAEWLQKSMPEGSMEGGFIPRFLIIAEEEYGQRMVPLPRYDFPPSERKQFDLSYQQYLDGLRVIMELFPPTDQPREIHPTPEAQDLYRSWYMNRFDRFSNKTREYANRCRNMVLTISMLSGISRLHWWIDPVDVEFSLTLMDYVAQRIDRVVTTRLVEDKIMDEILRQLPDTAPNIIKTVGLGYRKEDVMKALATLVTMELVSREGPLYKRRVDAKH